MSPYTKLILLFVLLLLQSGSATQPFLPNEIPAHTNWSFSVALNSSDAFDVTEIYFNDKRVVSAYSNGRALIDPQNGGLIANAFILDSVPENNSGLILYVSHLGIDSGEYKIRAEALKGGALIESASGAIEVFDAVAKSYADELNKQIEALRKLSKEIENNLNEIEKSVGENSAVLEQEMAQSKESLSKLQALYSDFKSEIDAIDNNLKENSEKTDSLNKETQKLKTALKEYQIKLEEIEGYKPTTAYAAMANFSAIAPVVIVAMFALFLWSKRQMVAGLFKRNKAP